MLFLFLKRELRYVVIQSERCVTICILPSRREEAACAVIVKVGLGIVGYGLAVLGLFAGALDIAEITVGVHGFFGHSVPRLGYYGHVFVTVKNAVAHAICHAVDEESGACHFLAAEIGGVVERYVPEAVLTLTFHKRGTHVLKVFLILFAVGVISRNLVKYSHESSHDPTVTARPIAVFAVGLLVGGHKVGVAPPQAIFLVVKTPARVLRVQEYIS